MKITKGYSDDRGRPQQSWGAYGRREFLAAAAVATQHRNIPVEDLQSNVYAEETWGNVTSQEIPPPEFAGEPFVLYGKVIVQAGGTLSFPTEALRNPFKDPIEIQELRIEAEQIGTVPSGGINANGAVAFGAQLALSLRLGNQLITKDFVPINLMYGTKILGSELNASQSGTTRIYLYMRQIPLARSIILAPNEGLTAAIQHRGIFNKTAITVNFTMHGRSRPGMKMPNKRALPFFAGFQFAPQPYAVPAGPFFSSETDLQNTTPDQVNLVGMVGAVTLLQNATISNGFGGNQILQITSDLADFIQTNTEVFAPTELIEVGLTSRDGYPIVPVLTPYLMVFPQNDRFWPIDVVLDPNEYFLTQLDVANYTSGTALDNAAQFLLGIGLTGWREVAS